MVQMRAPIRWARCGAALLRDLASPGPPHCNHDAWPPFGACASTLQLQAREQAYYLQCRLTGLWEAADATCTHDSARAAGR